MNSKSKLFVFFSIFFLLSSSLVYSESLSEKVNINTASIEQLIELPGIGESTAQKIIDYRKKNGNFTSINQLLEIKGIGEKKLEKIEGNLTL